MVDCDWIILCDYAFAAAHGKLCIIGVFDAILAKKVPATHPRSSVGFSLVGEPGEQGEAKLEIIGPTGKIVVSATMRFALPDGGTAQGSIDLPPLHLEEFGRYAIQIDLGDALPKQAWFAVKQLPE